MAKKKQVIEEDGGDKTAVEVDWMTRMDSDDPYSEEEETLSLSEKRGCLIFGVLGVVVLGVVLGFLLCPVIIKSNHVFKSS